jgi:uncharacterized surface protein with fasciclin (FAS1) repeats
MRTISTAMVSIALVVSACSDNDDDTALRAIENDSELTTFTAAIEFASVNNDLVHLLDQHSNTATVFAPTNAAFDALAIEITGNQSAVGIDLLVPTNMDLVRGIVEYHIVGTPIHSDEIPYGLPIETLQGAVFKIDIGSPPIITDGQNRRTAIISGDIHAGNGVVHKIDGVLLPPNKTIAQTVQAAAQQGEFTIFAQAVSAAQLVGVLDGSAPLTLFAPTDAAFVSLLVELRLSLPQILQNPQLLVGVLQYHVVAGDNFVAALPIGTPIPTVEGGVFTIDQNLVITDGRGRTAHIVKTDVLTSNGVIHVVDRVLLPPGLPGLPAQ